MSLLKNNTSVCIPAATTPDYLSNPGRTVSARGTSTALNEDQFPLKNVGYPCIIYRPNACWPW